MPSALHEAEETVPKSGVEAAKRDLLRYFHRVFSQSVAAGNQALREENHTEVLHKYGHAAMQMRKTGDYAKLHRVLEYAARPILAKPEDNRTEDDKSFLNGIVYIDKWIDKERESRNQREEQRRSVFAAIAISVVAAVSVGLGVLLSSVKLSTGYATTGGSGDSSAILAVFLLLVLLYFWTMKPEKSKRTR